MIAPTKKNQVKVGAVMVIGGGIAGIQASLITPVPGGVGTITMIMLLYNTVESAKIAAGSGAEK